jgi:prophage tail gpP-like protein
LLIGYTCLAPASRRKRKNIVDAIFFSRMSVLRGSPGTKGCHFVEEFHLQRKNKATETYQRQKITTVPEIAKRPADISSKRSLLFWKNEATEAAKRQKITTVREIAGENKATGGYFRSKVTLALKKRSDGGDARVKSHHCAGET